ncbi:MFS transporter [Tsukamurella soli]|uniref:MFS transporter n=1 Tax=Tsukamurella soli TaxID=644556 RepID=A0ABP8K7G4_9ACTN
MISRFVGWLSLFMVGTDLFVVSPLLPQISEEAGVSLSVAAWMVTAFSLAYIVGGPFNGALAERIGHRRVLLGALAAFAAANLITAIPAPFWVLLAARLLAGAAASGITPTIYALIGASAPGDQRAGWLATVTSGLLLALATGAPLGTLFAAWVGWHMVFVVLAAATVGLQVLVASTVKSQPATEGGGRSAAAAVLATWSRVRAVAVTMLWAFAVYGLYTYLGTILRVDREWAPSLVAAALVCYGLGAVVGNLIGGKLADRYGGRVVSVAGLVLVAVVEALFGVLMHAPTAALLCVFAAFALAAYPFFPAQQARLVVHFGNRAGGALAWNNSAMYVGILIGSIVGGPVLHAWGPSRLAWMTAAVAVVAALVAARGLPVAADAPSAV